MLDRPGVEPREGGGMLLLRAPAAALSGDMTLRRGEKGVVPREGGMPLMPLKGVPLRLSGVPAWLRDGPRDMEAPYCDAEGGKDDEFSAPDQRKPSKRPEIRISHSCSFTSAKVASIPWSS